MEENKKGKVVGCSLIIFILFVAAAAIWWFVRPMWDRHVRLSSSDAHSTTSMRTDGDGYFGYFFTCSPEMAKQGAQRGVSIEYTDDGGEYATRLQRFAANETDCMLIPVSEYLRHGWRYDFPGVIIAGISASNGADGIVGFKKYFPNGKIEELNNPDVSIAFLPQSVQQFVLDCTIVDFDLFNLARGEAWKVKVNKPEEAVAMLRKGEVKAAVLWEPDLSRVRKEIPELCYIWGSDHFSGYIFDVFVVRREYLRQHKGDISLTLETYFRVLRQYNDDRKLLVSDMRRWAKLDEAQVTEILDKRKVNWFSLQENCSQLFQFPTFPGETVNDGLLDCIYANIEILLQRADPATEDGAKFIAAMKKLRSNPYDIVNSEIITEVLEKSPQTLGQHGEAAYDFPALDENGWKALKDFGAMRDQPVEFEAGKYLLSPGGEQQVDSIAATLKNNYPYHRVKVRGHTNAIGDPAENLTLSQKRAEAVAKRLVVIHNLDEDRFHAEGVGSNEPPKQKPGESVRELRRRAARVEFILVDDRSL